LVGKKKINKALITVGGCQRDDKEKSNTLQGRKSNELKQQRSKKIGVAPNLILDLRVKNLKQSRKTDRQRHQKAAVGQGKSEPARKRKACKQKKNRGLHFSPDAQRTNPPENQLGGKRRWKERRSRP